MPQCPHCQTEYDKGQRYCSVCGSFLLHPEEGDTFCPQCGVRVSPRQEFCHECDAPLKGEGLRKVEVAPGVAPPEPAPKPTGAPASASPALLGHRRPGRSRDHHHHPADRHLQPHQPDAGPTRTGAPGRGSGAPGPRR